MAWWIWILSKLDRYRRDLAKFRLVVLTAPRLHSRTTDNRHTYGGILPALVCHGFIVTLLPTETRRYIVANGDAPTARLYNDNDDGMAMVVSRLRSNAGGLCRVAGHLHRVAGGLYRVASGLYCDVGGTKVLCRRLSRPLQATKNGLQALFNAIQRACKRL